MSCHGMAFHVGRSISHCTVWFYQDRIECPISMNEFKVEMKWWFQRCSNLFSFYVLDILFCPGNISAIVRSSALRVIVLHRIRTYQDPSPPLSRPPSMHTHATHTHSFTHTNSLTYLYTYTQIHTHIQPHTHSYPHWTISHAHTHKHTQIRACSSTYISSHVRTSSHTTLHHPVSHHTIPHHTTLPLPTLHYTAPHHTQPHHPSNHSLTLSTVSTSAPAFINASTTSWWPWYAALNKGV